MICKFTFIKTWKSKIWTLKRVAGFIQIHFRFRPQDNLSSRKMVLNGLQNVIFKQQIQLQAQQALENI